MLSPALYRAGSGEPLVLIHGFTATWRCWLPVLGELAARFEVIAPTLHGHDGGPSLPEGPAHSLSVAADHLERLLDDFGVDTAHLAGNSMGGALSLELAKRGRARSVVAISPGGGWREGDSKEVERIITLFKRSQKLAKAMDGHMHKLVTRPKLRQLALRDVMVRGHLVPAAEAANLIRSSVRCSIVDDVFETMRNGSARVVDLDGVKCPTLVTWGDRDRILPMRRHAPRLQEELTGAEFRVHPGIGHTPMWDDAPLIARTIGDWAAAAAASSSGSEAGGGAGREPALSAG